jgi:hypothetical protein
MEYAVDMDSSCMKFGIGVQAILRYCLRNLNRCNVGVSEGKEL